MPVFMIERRYAEQLDVEAADLRELAEINADEDVRWLYSFLSADKRKTFCLYDAPDADAVRRAAVRAGLPADVIVEVTDKVMPDGTLTPI